MASKKLKKFLAAGVAAYAGSKMLGQKKEMKEYLKTEGGDKSKINYITKKKGLKEKVMDAVNVYKGKNKNFGLGDMDGAKYGKMIKASNGVMVESRGNKLARSKPTKIC